MINTLVERSGAPTALVTTRGFRDVLEAGRGNRPDTFNLFYRRDPVLVTRAHRHEISERIDGQGAVITPPQRDEVEKLAMCLRNDGATAVAVSFLNAYLAPEHEQQVAQWLRELLPGVFVTCGTDFSTYQRLKPEAGDARLVYLRGQPIADHQAVEGTVFGRFVDRFTRRNGEWRVARRTVIFEVYRRAPAPAGGGLEPHWTTARRDGNDPLELARAALRFSPEP